MLIMEKAVHTLSDLNSTIYIALKDRLGKISCCVPKMPMGLRDNISFKTENFQNMMVPLKLVFLPIWPSTELLLCFP